MNYNLGAYLLGIGILSVWPSISFAEPPYLPPGPHWKLGTTPGSSLDIWVNMDNIRRVPKNEQLIPGGIAVEVLMHVPPNGASYFGNFFFDCEGHYQTDFKNDFVILSEEEIRIRLHYLRPIISGSDIENMQFDVCKTAPEK